MNAKKVYCPDSIIIDSEQNYQVYDTCTLKGYEVTPFVHQFLSLCRSPQSVYTLCKKLVIALGSVQNAREVAPQLVPFFRAENDEVIIRKTRLIQSEGLLGFDWHKQSEPLNKLRSFFRLPWMGFLFVLLSIYFLHQARLIAAINASPSFDYPLLVVLIVLFSTLIHEFGHIIAFRALGGTCYSFGLGIYYIVPVLFVDLSLSNRMSKKKRIVISLSGVYFELLYVALLLLVDAIAFSGGFRLAAFLIFIQTLWNLNPFFKNDGYWVLSDVLQESWLKQSSYSALKQTVLGRSFNALLSLYAVSHGAFYAAFFSWLGYKLYSGYDELVRGFIGLVFSADVSGLTTLHLSLILILIQAFRSAARLLQWVRLSWLKS